MKTGKINQSVGHPQTLSGAVRSLTLREQLNRVVNFKGINEVDHPIHGKLEVSSSVADDLLYRFEEGELVRLKRSFFES
jgi:hypothetical protein